VFPCRLQHSPIKRPGTPALPPRNTSLVHGREGPWGRFQIVANKRKFRPSMLDALKLVKDFPSRHAPHGALSPVSGAAMRRRGNLAAEGVPPTGSRGRVALQGCPCFAGLRPPCQRVASGAAPGLAAARPSWFACQLTSFVALRLPQAHAAFLSRATRRSQHTRGLSYGRNPRPPPAVPAVRHAFGGKVAPAGPRLVPPSRSLTNQKNTSAGAAHHAACCPLLSRSLPSFWLAPQRGLHFPPQSANKVAPPERGR
jgi:hypothetical protein